MAALATSSQLATSGTILGVTDRSAPSMFLRGGFQGPRPRNPADAAALSMRTSARATGPKQTRRTTQQQRGDRRRASSVVVCATGSGMNIVFVGAEMAPWSKTGGLGDVLGGLPPAMAVSSSTVPLLFPCRHALRAVYNGFLALL